MSVAGRLLDSSRKITGGKASRPALIVVRMSDSDGIFLKGPIFSRENSREMKNVNIPNIPYILAWEYRHNENVRRVAVLALDDHRQLVAPCLHLSRRISENDCIKL